jgi:HEAT repeat protein
MRSAGATLVPTLLDTLTAKKTFVRQAAAFSLAALQAEEAVPALIKLVARENTSLWEEFARALAAFGDVAIDSIVEAVEADSLPAERAALALAYLAKGGFASPVEELSAHSDPRVSAVATAVSTRIPTVEGHLREFYEAGVNPTGPREFGKRLFQALHPDPARRA